MAALTLKYFEAALMEAPGERERLLAEVNSPRRMLVELKIADAVDWLYVKLPKNPVEKTRNERPRALMNDDRHRRV